MKITKRQLKRIIRQEKSKILRENRSLSSAKNVPIVSFPDNMGYIEMVEEVHYICDEMIDGSVRLMESEDYARMLSFMYDAAEDGDQDIQKFLDMLSANRQGQHVRISLR